MELMRALIKDAIDGDLTARAFVVVVSVWVLVGLVLAFLSMADAPMYFVLGLLSFVVTVLIGNFTRVH